MDKLVNKVRACRNKMMKVGEPGMQGDSSRESHKDGRSSTGVEVNAGNSNNLLKLNLRNLTESKVY